MKRLLCFLLTICLLLPLLAACKPEAKNVKVGVLSGTTGMGILKMLEDGDERYDIEIYDAKDPQVLLNDLTAGKVQLAAIPTNAAAKIYNKTEGKIRMLALNTLGVLHLLDTTGSIETLEDLEGKTIYVPMKGQNPEYIVRHILAERGINANVVTDISDADTLQAALLSKEANYADVQIAVLPQPKVTVVKSAATSSGISLTTIDLSAEWAKVESTPIAQGCLVGNAEFVDANPNLIREFLQSYKASIEYIAAPENLDAAAALVVKHGIIPKAPVAKAALPHCSIAYMDGADMKSTLTTFYGILHAYDAKSIGGALPADAFYYNGK